MKGQKSRLKIRLAAPLVVILSLIICLGCAKKETIKTVSDEEVLRERIMAYWNHRMKEELDKSYDFEDPIYKKKFSLVSYIKSFGTNPVNIQDVSIRGIRRNDSTAEVDLDMSIGLKARGMSQPLKSATTRKDRWGKVEGNWYHVIGEPSAQSGDRK